MSYSTVNPEIIERFRKLMDVKSYPVVNPVVSPPFSSFVPVGSYAPNGEVEIDSGICDCGCEDGSSSDYSDGTYDGEVGTVAQDSDMPEDGDDLPTVYQALAKLYPEFVAIPRAALVILMAASQRVLDEDKWIDEALNDIDDALTAIKSKVRAG